MTIYQYLSPYFLTVDELTCTDWQNLGSDEMKHTPTHIICYCTWRSFQAECSLIDVLKGLLAPSRPGNRNVIS